jgi:hypothetical protein
MTDEEKAKKYAITRTYPKFETSRIANFVLCEIEGAFLAGLKASRQKWHKVADGDLPKEEDLEMQVLCFTYDGYQLLSLFSDPKPIFKGYGVIAWCEIPKYTEE